jgi:protein-tyrosine phosphatase
MNTAFSPNGYSRVLSFKGVSNFRDLGGYPTREGKQVKWGVLYRSGHLAKLRRAALRQFEQLQIHTLVDLRSDMERDKDPDRLPPSHSIRVRALPIFDEGNEAMVEEVKQRLKNNDFRGFDPDAIMVAAYRQFALRFSEQYRQFVHTVLEAGGAPVLWHCTAGKDRAGFAAALLLRILGVERRVAVQDYMLSAQYINRMMKLYILIWLTKGAKTARMLRSFVEVREHWIEAAFQAIDEHWGSFETYVEQALALSPRAVGQMRKSLLVESGV